MDLKVAGDYTSSEPRSYFWTKTRIIVWVLIPTAVLIWLLSSICWNSGCSGARDGSASAVLSQLSQAVKAYDLEFAAFPPGDGRGSSGLRSALAAPGAKNLPYFEFSPDSFDSKGNIRHPWDFEKLIHYRCPGVHNPKGFDLWCEDAKGRADGINNWGK